MVYDEFPLDGSNPGLGGGFFNGAQEFAFDKNALGHAGPTIYARRARAEGIEMAVCAPSKTERPPGASGQDR